MAPLFNILSNSPAPTVPHPRPDWLRVKFFGGERFQDLNRLRDAIQYKLETTEKGARICVATKDPDGLRAVHEFLRFQISDHQTGDTTEITKAL